MRGLVVSRVLPDRHTSMYIVKKTRNLSFLSLADSTQVLPQEYHTELPVHRTATSHGVACYRNPREDLVSVAVPGKSVVLW